MYNPTVWDQMKPLMIELVDLYKLVIIHANYDDAHDPTLQLMQALDHPCPYDPPDQNNFRDIGSTTLKWKDLHMAGDATIDGNLTVNGTTTTINSTQLDVDDINITIASGAHCTRRPMAQDLQLMVQTLQYCTQLVITDGFSTEK